jgi:hypothetical protein
MLDPGLPGSIIARTSIKAANATVNLRQTWPLFAQVCLMSGITAGRLVSGTLEDCYGTRAVAVSSHHPIALSRFGKCCKMRILAPSVSNLLAVGNISQLQLQLQLHSQHWPTKHEYGVVLSDTSRSSGCRIQFFTAMRLGLAIGVVGHRTEVLEQISRPTLPAFY